MTGCCPHLISFGKSQCSPALPEDILNWRTAQEGGYFLPLQWFSGSFSTVNNQKIFPLPFTTRAAPRSLLSSFQRHHCWVSGHFSPVMISFYYHWLSSSSHVRQTGKFFSVCWLCSLLIPTRGNKGGFLQPSDVSLNFIILARWQRGNALSFFCTRKKDNIWRWVVPAETFLLEKRPRGHRYLTMRLDGDLTGYIWEHVA